jgi:hypothetical protein
MVDKVPEFSSAKLGELFSTKSVKLWLDVTFVFNPFVNIFMITETLFSMCPSDNFLKQEEFISLLIDTKISCGLEMMRRKPSTGEHISIKNFVELASFSEFYCLYLLVVVRLDMRRKTRFINIFDCYSVTTEEIMKRLFDVAFLGGLNSSCLISTNECFSLDLIRSQFSKYSSEYGAKYHKIVKLNFDSVCEESETSLENLIRTSSDNLFSAHVR